MSEIVVIKNISNHLIGIEVPEMRLSRFLKPGASIKMESEKLEEALTYPGVPELFNKQYLACSDEKKLEEIAAGYVEPMVQEEALTEAELVAFIKDTEPSKLQEMLDNATENRKDTIVSAAMKVDGITYDKAKMIEKSTGVNIFKMRESLEDSKVEG